MINPKLYKNISNISYAFLIAGLFIIFITVGSLNSNAVAGTISGYACAIVATIFLASLTYTGFTSQENGFSWKDLLLTFAPYFMLLVIFGYSLTLIIMYYDDISNNKVSKYYTTFSYISVILIFIQVYTFYKIINTSSFIEKGIINTLSLVKLILLATCNIFVLISLGISLKYFSTDG